MQRKKKKRGFTDRLYLANMIAVHVIVGICLALTAVSGYAGITDLAPLSAIPTCAYGELALHTGFIIWKAKIENCRKNKDVNRLESLEREDFI